VGKALMGHEEGDEVAVSTPGGVTNYIILSIRPMYWYRSSRALPTPMAPHLGSGSARATPEVSK